jgi:lysophospholipase L1-like esterase
VIVLSIPDWGETPFAEGRDRGRIAEEINQFNAIGRDEMDEAGACYVDVTSESRRLTRDYKLIASDGLHPSGKMYEAWACLALPSAVTALIWSKYENH